LFVFLCPTLIKNLSVFWHPTVNCGVTNVNSSVIQNCLHFTITQVVTKIVADGYDNHVFLKLFSFELIHLHSSKLSISIILPQNELIGIFATETFFSYRLLTTFIVSFAFIFNFLFVSDCKSDKLNSLCAYVFFCSLLTSFIVPTMPCDS